MKKSFLLSTVSAVSLIVLASCGEASVSREQAKGRADNIATKEAASDFVWPTKFTAKVSAVLNLDNLGSGTIDTEYRVDTDNYYFYSATVMTSNSSSANSSTTIENYVYVDGTKLVIKLAGVDTSTTLTADLAKAGWKKASDTYVTEVTKDIKDIISSTVDFFKELTEASSSSAADDTKASEKYTSTGEGNLTINYTASMTAKDESSVSHSAETTFKAAFDNYLPVSYSATATADGVKVLDASNTISWNKCDIKKIA